MFFVCGEKHCLSTISPIPTRFLPPFFCFNNNTVFTIQFFLLFVWQQKICTFHFQWMNSMTLDIFKCTFKCHGILHGKVLWSLLSIKVHLSYRNSFANLALFIEIVFVCKRANQWMLLRFILLFSNKCFRRLRGIDFIFFILVIIAKNKMTSHFNLIYISLDNPLTSTYW